MSYQTHFFRTQNNLQKTSLGIKREMWFSVRLFVFATALLLVGGDTDADSTTTSPTDSTTGILYSVDLVANHTTQCSNIKTFYLEFLRGPVDQERIITVGESCVGVEDGTRWVEW